MKAVGAILAAVLLALLIAQFPSHAQVGLPFPGPGKAGSGGGAPAGPFVIKCHAFGNTLNTKMATNGNFGTGSNVDCTGANVFFCAISRFSGSGSLDAAADTSSNTYTQVGTEQASSTSTAVSLWRAFAASTSNTFHWSDLNGTANFATLHCAGFSDGSTSAEDTTATSAAANSPGSITPTGTNRVLIAGFVTHDPDSGAPTISAGGYTISDSQAYSGGSFEGGGMAYLIQTSAVAANPTFATTGGGVGASIQQAFR